MTKENIESLDIRFPLDYEIGINRDLDYDVLYKCGPTYNRRTERFTEWHITFKHPQDLEPIEQVALMYYQFDKLMKEKFIEIINDYLTRERSRRIDLT